MTNYARTYVSAFTIFLPSVTPLKSLFWTLQTPTLSGRRPAIMPTQRNVFSLPRSSISVLYGASGAPKNAGRWPNSRARPAEWPGVGCGFLGFPAPAPAPPVPQTGPG